MANEIITHGNNTHDYREMSGHHDADMEARGMPKKFIDAKDSVSAYADRAKDLPLNGKAVMIRYHLDNAMRIGVSPGVLSEIVKALRILEDIL